MTESKERPDLMGELMESMVKAGMAEKQPDGTYRGIGPARPARPARKGK